MNTRSVLMIASGVMVTLVTVALARLSFGLILPAMRGSLDLSYAQAGHLGTATALGYLSLVMVAGTLAGRYGGRVSVLLGLVCVIVGFAGLSMANDYKQLLALMTLLGFGTAFAYTPLISLIGTWFPTRRGLVIGLLNSGVGTGMMSAGWIVPYMTQLDADDGWRRVWMLFAGVAIIALAASAAYVRNPPRPARRPPALTIAERRSARWAVLGNPYVVIVGLIYGIVGVTYIVQAIFMYSYALAADIEPEVAGALASFMGMLGIVFGPLWGSLSDRLGRGQSLLLSMGLALVSTLLPVLSPTLFGFVSHYLILGVAVTGMFTSCLAASTERVNVDQAPLAVSYVTMFFAVGQLIGPSAAGWLIATSGEFRSTFAASAALMLVGVLLSYQLMRLRKSN